MEEQESYLLITRYLANQTSTEENELLADWIAISKANELLFEDIKAIWQASKATENIHPDIALNKLHEMMRNAEAGPAIRLYPYKKWYVIAASLICLVTVTYLIARYIFTKAPDLEYVKQTTKAGQKRVIYLEDGTEVHLAPQSTIEYPVKFDAGKRLVNLVGEAYFEVSKNPHKPFIVHTQMLNVQVLGTHFNVDSYKSHNSTVVSLLEGKVKVTLPTEDTDEYLLKPGQQLTLNHLNHRVYQHAFDTTSVTAWMTNTLVFKNDKLADAAEKINQMYGVKMVFADQVTADTRLYGTFNNESLVSVMETIKATGNITYRIDGNKIYLTLKQ